MSLYLNSLVNDFTSPTPCISQTTQKPTCIKHFENCKPRYCSFVFEDSIAYWMLFWERERERGGGSSRRWISIFCGFSQRSRKSVLAEVGRHTDSASFGLCFSGSSEGRLRSEIRWSAGVENIYQHNSTLCRFLDVIMFNPSVSTSCRFDNQQEQVSKIWNDTQTQIGLPRVSHTMSSGSVVTWQAIATLRSAAHFTP